jgi:hypothetical protein
MGVRDKEIFPFSDNRVFTFPVVYTDLGAVFSAYFSI